MSSGSAEDSNNEQVNVKKPPWEVDWARANAAIARLQTVVAEQPKKPLQVLRVNQLDAIRLDSEIGDLLGSQFMKIFAFFKTDFVEKFKPELTLCLDLLIYRFSIYASGTTFGNRLQNLRFSRGETGSISKTQTVFYGLFTVGFKWMWTRLNAWVSARDDWGDLRNSRMWATLSFLESAYKTASILNFFVFLVDGRFVSVVNRLLSMRLVYNTTSARRNVSFEWMNRQLVWHGFTEFMIFVMPLINLDKLKNFVRRRLYTPAADSALPATMCPVCQSDPAQTPHVSSCGHLFCYYCLRRSITDDSRFACPRCNLVVTSMRRAEAADLADKTR
eukprot:TRINITY_DN5125_c0_g2_i1.p1 TRINITY_DN5125_c0_g2~~TRINITY_DN5125_c0_g2_i1.p1  ORF type:complete len:332 (+),score=85.64 TRINITY_DN5125_c0_g2_i1:112-1107(+)